MRQIRKEKEEPLSSAAVGRKILDKTRVTETSHSEKDFFLSPLLHLRTGVQRCPKESEHPIQTALAEQYIQNMSGAYNKKCAPGAGPTLQLDVAYAPPRTAPG